MIRNFIGVTLIIFGIFTMIIAIIGIFRFKYVLNRMQAAALVDTLGILLLLAGIVVLSGWSILSAKTILIIIFIWLASPVTSHLIAHAEITVNPNIKAECEVVNHEDYV